MSVSPFDFSQIRQAPASDDEFAACGSSTVAKVFWALNLAWSIGWLMLGTMAALGANDAARSVAWSTMTCAALIGGFVVAHAVDRLSR